MYVLLLVIYLLIVVVLIFVVLIQEPRTGGGMILGGGVEHMIGVRTAPTFFTNLTIGLGAAFGLLAFILSMLSGAGSASKSVVIKEAGKGTVYKLLQEMQVPPPTTQPGNRPQQGGNTQTK